MEDYDYDLLAELTCDDFDDDDDYGDYDNSSEYDDSLDGDFDSAMESAGHGYDEQYEHYDAY
jgi:hypothetical protein